MSTLIESCMIRHQCKIKINYDIPDLWKINVVAL